MSDHDDFFKQSKAAQATLKHAILRGYLATFATATGKKSEGHRVGYIDGYAGPGEYVNDLTGARSDGSPLIAINEIRHQLTLSEPRHLECVFVEKETKYFAPLEQIVSVAAREGLPVQAIQGDVTKHLTPAIEGFNDVPLLVFLDPFGASLPHTASVPAVLQRDSDQPTEVLLNFSVETLRRAGARIHEPEDAKGRTANLATMDRWLGGDWWRQFFLDPATVVSTEAAYEPAERITDEYARRVCAETSCKVFPVNIRRAANHKPLFRLMLFHPKPLAAYKFNDSVSRGHDAWRAIMWDMDMTLADREDRRDPIPGFSHLDAARAAAKADKDQFFDDTVSTIKDTIRATLKTQTFVSVEKEFYKVFGEAAGLGRGTHLTKAWDALTDEGVTQPRKGSKYDWATIWRAQPVAQPTFR